MSPAQKYYGKYRGTVMNNADPEQRARLLVTVPDVSGTEPSTWALPSVPLAGSQMGVFVAPQVGALVWVEFEQGDPDHPVWTGGFWGSSSDVPSIALSGMPASPSIVLQTGAGHQIVISDVPGQGGITLKIASGATISITDNGITISNGQGASLSLSGSTVSVNNGAMDIT